jgi:hypothetical protein
MCVCLFFKYTTKKANTWQKKIPEHFAVFRDMNSFGRYRP